MDNGASSYRRFLDGDESAFDEIMKELFDNLVFFIDRYVHDIHAAEDIAIDAFSDLVVNKHRYNFKVTLKTYLFMLGRSRALNYIKHRKVIDFVELTEAEKASSEQETLEEIVLADERKRVVNNALNSLLSVFLKAMAHTNQLMKCWALVSFLIVCGFRMVLPLIMMCNILERMVTTKVLNILLLRSFALLMN